jgi:hypothetical protein
MNLENVLGQCNYGITTSLLDDFLPFQQLPKRDRFYHTLIKKEKKIMPAYLINMDKMEVVCKFAAIMDADQVGQKSKFTYLVFSKMKDLDQLPVTKIVELKENIAGKKYPSDKKKGKDKLIPTVWGFIKNMELPDAPELPKRKEKKAASERKTTKVQIIREMFAEKGIWTKEEIMKKTGFNSQNANTAMGILKNPKRTKVLLLTTYDRKEKSYTLTGHK